jgi:ATP-dependent exoDNAse (exonuclease V) beta subunit
MLSIHEAEYFTPFAVQDYDPSRSPGDHAGMAAMHEVVSKLAFFDDMTSSQDGPVQQAVQMMTLHKAKGLEFSVVILLGLDNTGIFGRAGHQADDLKGLEQRTNLVYVGVTRTENLLAISTVMPPAEGKGANWRGRRPLPSEPSIMLTSMMQEFGVKKELVWSPFLLGLLDDVFYCASVCVTCS